MNFMKSEQQVCEPITLRAHNDESAVTDLMCFSLHYDNSGGGRDGDENLRVKEGYEIYRIWKLKEK